MKLDLDIEQFWRDEDEAHKDNCFSPDAKQVALGIRMSDECVFAELGEDGQPCGIFDAGKACDGVVVDVHIKLDTGMTRVGFQTDEVNFGQSLTDIIEVSKMENVKITGIDTKQSQSLLSHIHIRL